GADRRHISDVLFELDRGGNRRAHQLQGFAHDLGEIRLLLFRLFLAAESENAADEIAGALACLIDRIQIVAHRRTRFEAPRRQLRQRHDRHQRVVQIMRDAAGERAERFELLRMQQLALEFAFAYLCDNALRDIVQRAEDAYRTAALTEMRVDLAAQHAFFAIGPDNAEFEHVGIPLARAVLRLAEGFTVFGMHILQRRLPGRRRAVLIDAEDAIHLIRPGDLAGREVVIEAAHISDTLRAHEVFAALH